VRAQVYTIYSILSIVFVILLVVTAFICVAMTYFQLAVEDHRWWWRSFLCGGSTGAPPARARAAQPMAPAGGPARSPTTGAPAPRRPRRPLVARSLDRRARAQACSSSATASTTTLRAAR